MTDAERALWKQAQEDYSHALQIAAKAWERDAMLTDDAVVQAAAATVLIHITKLRQEVPRSLPVQAAPTAGKGDDKRASQASVAVPPCPQCGGPMADKRAEKRSEKAPDFVCAQVNGNCGKRSKDGKKWFPTGKWADKDERPAMAAAETRTLAEIPVALDRGDAAEDEGLPW